MRRRPPRSTRTDTRFPYTTLFRSVQTNLAFSTEQGVPRSFSVTSTRPREGKSTTCLALATTLTRGGKRVILVDGDMRNPSIHQLAGVRHDRGLSNYLTGEDNIDFLTFPMEDQIGRAHV